MQDAVASRSELNAAFYSFTQDILGVLGQAMSAVQVRSTEPSPIPPPLLQVKRGYAESPGWFLVQAAEFDPEPLTVAGLRIRDIYASEAIVQALLDMMASEKWLDRRDNGEYFLDQTARDILQRSRDRQNRYIAQLEPLPAEEMAELKQLLSRVIEACRQAPGLEGWCLSHSINRSPDDRARPLNQIRQYLEDLNAFRDDAHMAAWQPYNISGHVWEAFAHVCSGEAATGDALFNLLSHRGNSRSDYSAALAELAARGWITESSDDSGYIVSPQGQEIRGTVEGLTDSYFFGPWKSNLSEGEIPRLRDLLEKMQLGLEAAAL